MSTSFCDVPLPKLVYARPSSREEFDRLDLPAQVYDWKADSTFDLIKGDGQRWERRLTVKSLEANGITVIFQWSDKRVIQGAAQSAEA
jgi:hypothetical protein